MSGDVARLHPCPICANDLEELGRSVPVGGAMEWRCSACSAIGLSEASLTEEGRRWVARLAHGGASSRTCPICGDPLEKRRRDALEIERCDGCRHLVLDASSAAEAPARAAREAFYLFSLPERSLRSVLGTVGATTRELTHVLVPPLLRRTRLWQSAVERSLRILAEGVGRVQGGSPDATSNEFARLAVGSVVDTAALVVFHVSPLWILAAVSDVAQGSRRYLDEVVRELKARGALSREENVEGIDQLLAVLERTSSGLHADVDKPPLSVPELRRTVARVREDLGRSEESRTGLQKEAREIAAELEEVSEREGRSIAEVSNAVAIGAVSSARMAGRAAAAGLDVATRIVVEQGWRPYRAQLAAVKEIGYARYVGRTARPIARAIAANFDPREDTVTAQILSGRLWRRAITILRERRRKGPRAPGATPEGSPPPSA